MTKDRYRLALKNGIGAPSVPVVAPNDPVQRGQMIARYVPEALSVSLHSPVTGVVEEVTAEAVVIRGEKRSEDFLALDRTLPVGELVRSAGIIGQGGAGFPAYVKLQTDLKDGGYVLCNAAECEPGLCHNLAQIKSNPQGLLRGMRIAMEATGAPKGIIGIKWKHRDTIRLLTGTLKRLGIGDIRVLPLRNVYPVGEERALIRDTLNILLGPGELPMAAHCVVFNAETLDSIRRAVDEGKPLIDKWLTVTGAVNGFEKGDSRVLEVPIGTPVEKVLADLGGVKEPLGEVLLGGPYTGHRAEAGEGVTKILGGIIPTEPFEKVGEPLGIIQCACGPTYPRMLQIAQSMGAPVVAHEICKNAHEVKGAYKCENPGHCPGQAEKVLALKKAGATHVLIGHCTDCTNTVMGSAPKLQMTVHHCTDHIMKTLGKPLIRTYDEDQL
ncbi:Electron transport complex protein RnfC [Clostridiaceae bacterium JG1575]|nr:Electron transport complex protein RnfC [Clostridiaceae bacterium JG1575]